jgi:hypothetical protein
MNNPFNAGRSNRLMRVTARALTALSLALALLVVTSACSGAVVGTDTTATPGGQSTPGSKTANPRPGDRPLSTPGAGGHATGFMPNPQARPAVPATNSGALPAVVDLGYYNPPVGDQGQVGSCVAWATAYYLRGWYADRDGYYPDDGFSSMYTYAQIAKGSDNGSTFAQNLDIQKGQGVDTRRDYLGDRTDDYATQPSDAERTNAARYKIADYVDVTNGYRLGGPTANTYATAFQLWIENVLATRNPIAIALPVYSEFEHASSTTSYIDTPHFLEFSAGDHAVFAYGYDQKGLWIENSWGTDWGKNGTAELSWDFVKFFAFEAVAISPPTRPTAWLQLPGSISDISIGANGSVWAIGTNPVYGGNGIYQWDAATWTWNAVDGGAVRIAVDPSGNPWVVNKFGNIFRRAGSAWQQVSGSARDIAIGGNGYVWIVGWTPSDGYICRPGPCDGGIYLYNGLGWQQIPGLANRIAVDGQGIPWVVTTSGAISQWVGFDLAGNHWQQMPGSATDIVIGGEPISQRMPWVIGSDSGIYYGHPIIQSGVHTVSWTAIPGSGIAIAAAPSDNPWIVNSDGSIVEYYKEYA